MVELGFVSTGILRLINKAVNMGNEYNHVPEKDQEDFMASTRTRLAIQETNRICRFTNQEPFLREITIYNELKSCRNNKESSELCGLANLLKEKKSSVYDLFYYPQSNTSYEKYVIKYYTFGKPPKNRDLYSCSYCFFQKIFNDLLDEVPHAKIEVRLPNSEGVDRSLNLIGLRKRINDKELGYKANCFLALDIEEDSKKVRYLVTTINKEINLITLKKHPNKADVYIIQQNQGISEYISKKYSFELIDLSNLYFIRGNNDLLSIKYQFNESIEIASKLEFDKAAFLGNSIPEKIFRKKLPEVIDSTEEEPKKNDTKKDKTKKNEPKKPFSILFWIKVLIAPTIIGSAFLIFKYTSIFSNRTSNKRPDVPKRKGI